MRRGERMVIEDLAQSPMKADCPARQALEAAGVQAVQSTPVLARGGRLVGVFSTHWTQPWHPDDASLRLLDLLARDLGDMLENQAAPARAKKQAGSNG
jgi:GAF domain-containing protein